MYDPVDINYVMGEKIAVKRISDRAQVYMAVNYTDDVGTYFDRKTEFSSYYGIELPELMYPQKIEA